MVEHRYAIVDTLILDSYDELHFNLCNFVAVNLFCKVPVGFCSPKHIRKPPGGKLGLVSVLQSKGTVYGRPDRGEIYVRVFGPTDI